MPTGISTSLLVTPERRTSRYARFEGRLRKRSDWLDLSNARGQDGLGRVLLETYLEVLRALTYVHGRLMFKP